MTRLLHVPVPPGTAHFRVFPDTDPDLGAVAFTARPTRNAWAVGQDLLAGLGKRDDVAGAGRSHAQDLDLITAWLRAHRVTHVVARHADNLDATVLDALTLMTAAAGATLALVHDDGTGQHVIDHVLAHGGTAAAPAEVARLLHPTTGAAHQAGDTATVGGDWTLPSVAFPLFRAACRDLLAPGRREAVDRLYRDTFRIWRQEHPDTAEDAHALLTRLCSTGHGPAHSHVVARAAQACALTHGHHLKVDMPTLLLAVAEGAHRRLTDDEVLSLRAYRQPWRPTAVALRDADLSMDEMHALALADTEPDGTVPTAPLLHPFSRTYIRAQRTWRTLNGAAPTDGLLEIDTCHALNGILAAGTDLGLPGPGSHSGRGERREDRWRHRLGLALIPLAGPAVRPRM